MSVFKIRIKQNILWYTSNSVWWSWNLFISLWMHLKSCQWDL